MNLLSGSFVRSTKSGGGRGRCCRPHVAVDGPRAFRIDCAQYILNCLADGGVGPKCGWLIQMVKIIVQNEWLQEIGKVVFDSKWPVACWIICSISSSCSFGMKSASRHYSGVRDSKRSYMVSDSSIQMSQRAYSGVQRVDGFKGLQPPEDHFFPDG